MSCSISNSSRQLHGFAIRDISMSDPATELIPSPSDSKLLFAIVPIILLGLTIMPLIWLHFIKCRYPGVGSQFSILNYCSTDSKRVSILINLTHSTGCQLSSHIIILIIQSSCLWLLSQEQCLPYLAYSLYATYPACSLWLFLPIHCMRLILPAHYGYSCLWLLPKEQCHPVQWLQLITLWLLSKEQCRSLLSSLVKQVFNIQHFIIRVAMVPSAYYYIPIPALLIWVATVPSTYPY